MSVVLALLKLNTTKCLHTTENVTVDENIAVHSTYITYVTPYRRSLSPQ